MSPGQIPCEIIISQIKLVIKNTTSIFNLILMVINLYKPMIY